MAARPDLSIVIVNWNVCELLRRCLVSIAGSDSLTLVGPKSAEAYSVNGPAPDGNPQTYSQDALGPPPRLTAEVIVVDNASSDGSVAMLEQQFPWADVIANDENIGFTRANNQGLRQSRGRYVFFLNPDTQLARATLTLLVGYADDHPRVGIVGPQLRYGDGTLQSSRRRFPTVATLFLESTILQRWWPQNAVLDRYYVHDRPDDAITAVDWVVGAAMLVRRDVLDQVGGFDEGFFMYSEELDLCRRAVNAGWQVLYVPAAMVTHYEGRSSEQAVAARHIHFHTSRVRYARKYHGSAIAQMLRIFLLGTFVYQWLEEAAKWLVGGLLPSQQDKRAMRLQRMAAYRQVIGSRLRRSRVPGQPTQRPAGNQGI